MSFFKKTVTNDAFAVDGDYSMFCVARDQLNELMKIHGKDWIEKLHLLEYNGVEGILEKLKVDRDRGLVCDNQEDFQQRRAAYGKNEIPSKPISFFQLPWYVLVSGLFEEKIWTYRHTTYGATRREVVSFKMNAKRVKILIFSQYRAAIFA